MNVKNTDRLILKVLDENYSNEVLSYFIRNKEFLKQWDPSRNKEFFTINYQKKNYANGPLVYLFLLKIIKRFRKDTT